VVWILPRGGRQTVGGDRARRMDADTTAP
jgi:hypothetical protein